MTDPADRVLQAIEENRRSIHAAWAEIEDVRRIHGVTPGHSLILHLDTCRCADDPNWTGHP
jgi:hypothetical protein